MFYFPKLYLRDPWIFGPLTASFILQAAQWWYIAANVRSTADQIFLHYNIIFGIDLIGPWWKIFLPPAAGLAFLAINFFLSFFLYRFDRLLARLLPLFTVGVEAVLLAAIAAIVGLAG